MWCLTSKGLTYNGHLIEYESSIVSEKLIAVYQLANGKYYNVMWRKY